MTVSYTHLDVYKRQTLPLVFLQVALEYTIHELIYLGLQICSHRENGSPLCSVQDLYACAKKLKGHRDVYKRQIGRRGAD